VGAFTLKTSIAKHLWIWVFVVPVLCIAIFPLLLTPNEPLINQTEVQSLRGAGVRVDEIEGRANEIFDRLFVQSGAVAASRAWIAVPSQNSGTEHVRSFSITYFAGFWKTLYRWVFRLLALGSWALSLGFIALVCCCADGLVSRARKRSEFGEQTMWHFYVAKHAIVGCVGALVILPLAPFALSAAAIAAIVAALGAVVWLGASNFQSV
jgi:hypothetical protein